MDVTRALTVPPGRMSEARQWKTAVLAANASPASSAPPGRRIPNSTASASQKSPMTGGAVLLLAVQPNRLRNTPPNPALPAPNGKTIILVPLGPTPPAPAPTSHLRTPGPPPPPAQR